MRRARCGEQDAAIYARGADAVTAENSAVAARELPIRAAFYPSAATGAITNLTASNARDRAAINAEI
jgi:hypothetical protein